MQEKVTYTVKEAAAVAGVSLPTMYDITERADFNALIRVGRKKLILKTRFNEWLEHQADKQVDEASAYHAKAL